MGDPDAVLGDEISHPWERVGSSDMYIVALNEASGERRQGGSASSEQEAESDSIDLLLDGYR